MSRADRKVVLVTRRTRLDELLARHQTLSQARYVVERLGGDFADFQAEHEAYGEGRRVVVNILSEYGRYQVVDRMLVSNFVFAPDDLVMALGQDGLVANTLKYLDGQPLVGINPDPDRFDGLLLPFLPMDLPLIFQEVLHDRRSTKSITMAEAVLSDGQRLLAVNDFFIGPRTHTSARYEISFGDKSEVQSSSGLIVATGLGSTAWIKSIVTGAMAVASSLGSSGTRPYEPLAWDSQALRFAVREPFPSRSSQATLIYGTVGQGNSLKLRSLMGGNGVIFSDGIEADYLEFNSGTLATVKVANGAGQLVT
ncbi:MAG: sugar kinase [Burkholderiales bacterium]|nr:sugar kinase [Burkholderiales bacterium]